MKSLLLKHLKDCGRQDGKCGSLSGPWPRSITTFPPNRAEHRSPTRSQRGKSQALQENCKEFGVRLFDIDSPEQGIVHVIGPELGLTQPGMTIVCGDSHTSTHGAFGALAFGIGTSEVEHVLATQCLAAAQAEDDEDRGAADGLPRASRQRIWRSAIIGQIGTDGATGHVIEYAGEVVRGALAWKAA